MDLARPFLFSVPLAKVSGVAAVTVAEKYFHIFHMAVSVSCFRVFVVSHIVDVLRGTRGIQEEHHRKEGRDFRKTSESGRYAVFSFRRFRRSL